MNIEDDEVDLTDADRGDEVAGQDGDGERPRGKDGKFLPRGSDEGGEDDGGEGDDEGDDEGAEDDAGGDEGDEGDEDEGADAGGDDENLTIRFRKMRDQRDRERQAREAAERRAQELAEALAKMARNDGGGDAAEADPIEAINAELDDLYEQVEAARLDGDAKTAAALQRKIDAKNREILTIETERKTANLTKRTSEQTRFEAMVDRLEAAMPIYDPDSDDYDAEAVKELEFHIVAYERAGLKPTEALAKAVRVLHKEDPFAKRRRAEADEPSAQGKKPEQKKPNPAKAVEHSRRQPPRADAAGVNRDSTKLNPGDISDEEWEKLPESKKAEMRGDHL